MKNTKKQLYFFFITNDNNLITESASGSIFWVNSENEVVCRYSYEEEGKLICDNWSYRAYPVTPEWIPGNPSNYDTWESLYEE